MSFLNQVNLYHLLDQALNQGQNAIHSLKGSSKSLVFSLVKEDGLLICADDALASQIYTDCLFWSEVMQTEPPLFIPSKGDPDRIKALRSFASLKRKKVVASIQSALSSAWTPETLPPVELAVGGDLGRDLVVDVLTSEGYRIVSIVASEGEMSIRGGIVDVFPVAGADYPVRVEFFGDEIESIRFFDIDTQRTVKLIPAISIPPAVEPESNDTILSLMGNCRIFLNEPDELKRHVSFPFDELKTVAMTSFALHGSGVDAGFASLHGLGMIKEEMKSLDDLSDSIRDYQNLYNLTIVCHSKEQAKRVRELLDEKNLPAPILKLNELSQSSHSIAIVTGELSTGFIYSKTIVITGVDIFGHRPGYKQHKRKTISKLLTSREELKQGDYVVHVDHGIGRYAGIVKQQVGDFEREAMLIEYLDGDRLYVPFERIDKLQKYHGGETVVPNLSKLGSSAWDKTKKRIKKKIKDMAEKIIKLHAKRYDAKGHAFSPPSELHIEFDGFFDYEETPDQFRAIQEIAQDMEDLKPMDRLLCGDVGYGKTEVAMRAAFKATFDSKQVAVVVPTTILAEQHFITFTARFSAFPVKIDYLSRFKSKKEQNDTMAALAKGDIDIVIGTQRLLSKDIQFFNLGLLIIDEEHKFGVAHKEKLKALKHNVDVLTLTATPIPRTLQMAISGIKTISTIETPPADRVSVRTIVAQFKREIVKEAIEREIKRGGQVFFVHNRIQSIDRIANIIHELMPGVSIQIAHGQMDEKALEKAMLSFMRKESQVLLSTSIISSGLDIPAANTIIVDRADRFGLADLYQLRGRVGRSDVRAFAYFLVPEEAAMTEDAKRRLNAIQELSYLGAGFQLAMKDMEIRGAGNLLGAEQSGQIETVGIDLYMDMLKNAVSELKGQEVMEEIEITIDLKVNAQLPETYIDDPAIRLSLYRKIATASEEDEIQDIFDELKDRFSQPPREAVNLLTIMKLKIHGRKAGVSEIKRVGAMIKIQFDTARNPDHEKIIAQVNQRKAFIKFLPEGGVILNQQKQDLETFIEKTLEFVKAIGPWQVG
jgi:transcription-repair coupling factor (superfamily II helicase)